MISFNLLFYENIFIDFAINFFGAVVAHGGCLALDFAVIPGLICHGAVALGHAAANDSAYLDYLDCIN